MFFNSCRIALASSFIGLCIRRDFHKALQVIRRFLKLRLIAARINRQPCAEVCFRAVRLSRSGLP